MVNKYQFQKENLRALAEVVYRLCWENKRNCNGQEDGENKWTYMENLMRKLIKSIDNWEWYYVMWKRWDKNDALGIVEYEKKNNRTHFHGLKIGSKRSIACFTIFLLNIRYTV